MKERRLAIAGLLLPEITGWTFAQSERVILGRRPEGPGHLQILHVSQDTLPQPVTHDFCLAVLNMMLKTGSDPTDRQMMESVCGPYGAATFRRPADVRTGQREDEIIRAWYCRRPPGLICGIFTCPQSAALGPAYELMIKQCARIMSDVLFDRASWGLAEEPLTRVLLANFERLEHEREPE